MKAAIKSLGLTQKAFAEQYGCELRTMEKNLAGSTESGIDLLSSFERAGINANWLLTGEGDMLLKSAPEAAPWAEAPDAKRYRYSKMEAMEPAAREATAVVDSSLLIRCVEACGAVYGEHYVALTISERVAYAAAFYNLLVRMAGGQGDIHRLEPAALADQLRLFVKMGMARVVPPPRPANLQKLI